MAERHTGPCAHADLHKIYVRGSTWIDASIAVARHRHWPERWRCRSCWASFATRDDAMADARQHCPAPTPEES